VDVGKADYEFTEWASLFKAILLADFSVVFNNMTCYLVEGRLRLKQEEDEIQQRG
jgi:hypothetical protein